jgi:hypothetical protein
MSGRTSSGLGGPDIEEALSDWPRFIPTGREPEVTPDLIAQPIREVVPAHSGVQTFDRRPDEAVVLVLGRSRDGIPSRKDRTDVLLLATKASATLCLWLIDHGCEYP